MPNYQDAYISDIVVTFDETPEHPCDKVVESLKNAGVQITSVDKDNCVAEGTVESCKVAAVDQLPGVDFVRTVFTYVADFPPGDPRDLDKVGREAE